MTLNEINQMQAARRTERREASKQREELRKQFKTYDKHDIDTWANNKPWWLLPLQALGVVAMSIGLFILMDWALWSIRVVLSL
tara:strand:- start:2337 stop:2585 length:249 start_codon:yes stop_codon:yes gene_type:complete